MKNKGEDKCQQICREIYSDRCTFFIYDRQNELCELFDYDEEIYVESCSRVGGTPTPTLVECQNSTDPCTVRKIYIILRVSPNFEITVQL